MPEPINGSITFNIDDKYMSASVIINEAQFGGKPVTYDDLCAEAAKNGIRRNLNEQAMRDIFEKKEYGRSIVIARGDRPVDGTDGFVTYNFEQKDTQEFVEDEFGNVNYRDLGFIRNIQEGTVIAEITPETQGEPGMDIRGATVAQCPGRQPVFVVGNGVELTEDGRKLIAAVSGNLRWNKNHFVVDKEVVINGDVDASVGNIDFIGNVTIKGNTNEGYEIRANGSVTVLGTVTGTKIAADGDISIRIGAVAADLSGRNISASFFENCTLNAKEKLTAQSFVACQAFCNGQLSASNGKGAIVGGKYTCLSNIEANIIGSDTYAKTMLVLGNVAILAEEKNDKTKRITEFRRQLDQIEKICTALQEQKKAGGITSEREEMLTTSIRAKFVHRREIKDMLDRIKQIDKEIDNNSDLCIRVRRSLFPGVVIKINGEQLVVDKLNGQCVVRMDSDGEIKIR